MSIKTICTGIGTLALIGGLAACGSAGGSAAAPTVTQTVVASAPAAMLTSVSSMWFSGEYLRCWYGRNAGHNWAEIVPDGTLGGVRTGWGKVYYVGPLYLGEFTVVAPNGVRLTYKPVS